MADPVEYDPHRDVIRHHCLIGTCTWAHEEPGCAAKIIVRADPVTGEPDVGDFDAAINRSIAEREQRIEAILGDHHATHPADDWVAEVRSLHHRMTVFTNELDQHRYGIRPHVRRDPAELERTVAAMRTRGAVAPLFGERP